MVTGEKNYIDVVVKVITEDRLLDIDPQRVKDSLCGAKVDGGSITARWGRGHTLMTLGEYHLSTKDKSMLQALPVYGGNTKTYIAKFEEHPNIAKSKKPRGRYEASEVDQRRRGQAREGRSDGAPVSDSAVSQNAMSHSALVTIRHRMPRFATCHASASRKTSSRWEAVRRKCRRSA